MPKIASRRPGPPPHAPGAETQARLLVIYNPLAGRWRRQRFQQTLRALAASGCRIAVRETAASGEAARFASEAIGGGFAAIVVAGGDGTINEVAGVLAGSGETLGIIPLGTANVLAAEIGVPGQPRRIAAILAGGKRKRVRIGKIGNHRFVMMAGVGFGARTVARVAPGLKRLTGKFAYLVAALAELIHHQPGRIDLTLDGSEFAAASAVIANGHYYAGRFVLAPEACLEEPALHVCLFGRSGRWNQVRYALAMVLGRLGRLPDVRIVKVISGVISGSDNEPVQADGDIIGRTPIAFALLPGSLSVLAP
ncbi:MAG: diacylglycerol/lipid kinase family protein [Alphaproteobacteria bacterium]